MVRILYVAPVKSQEQHIGPHPLAETLQPGSEFAGVGLRRGPGHLEYHYYETMVLPDLVHTIVEAERRDFDAVVIGCFYDFGLEEGREVTERLVVTAPCESSVLLAASLGHTFSIIVGRRKWIPQMHANVVRYGLASRLASFRTIDLWVPQYHEDEAETARRFREQAHKAVHDDGAEVIILGCTASAGFYRELQDELGVPVIDSAVAAIKRAEHLVDMRDRFGWSHSKIGGYESPPIEELERWGLREQYEPLDITELWVDLVVTPSVAD